MIALGQHADPHRRFAVSDAPHFIRVAPREHLLVQFTEIYCHRNRHPVIAPEIAGFPFDAALFVTSSGRAELARESPM
jgi:hypothetical protein